MFMFKSCLDQEDDNFIMHAFCCCIGVFPCPRLYLWWVILHATVIPTTTDKWRMVVHSVAQPCVTRDSLPPLAAVSQHLVEDVLWWQSVAHTHTHSHTHTHAHTHTCINTNSHKYHIIILSFHRFEWRTTGCHYTCLYTCLQCSPHRRHPFMCIQLLP